MEGRRHETDKFVMNFNPRFSWLKHKQTKTSLEAELGWILFAIIEILINKLTGLEWRDFLVNKICSSECTVNVHVLEDLQLRNHSLRNVQSIQLKTLQTNIYNTTQQPIVLFNRLV